jgi:hypothetical protein
LNRQNLASNQERKLRIVDEEAQSAIVLAMVVFSDEVMVQQQACQVLLQLAVTENCKSIQASNVRELVQAVADKFDDCKEPAEWLFNTLDEFASSYTEIGEA